MDYKQFGSTGIAVSPICFGSMRLDPSPDGRKIARRALDAALDSGINLLHSSDSYGTRDLMGEALADRSGREDLHHIVKVCAPDYRQNHFDAAVFRDQVEKALRELRAERITFVQHLHRGVTKSECYSPAGDALRLAQLHHMRSEIEGVFADLRQEGKVRHLLCFPHTRVYAGAAVDGPPFEGLVAFFNLLEREMADLFPQMEAQGLGMFAMRPLLQGMLSDRRADRAQLPPDDRMRGSEWDIHYQRLHTIRERLGETDLPLETIALQFSLIPKIVASVIVSLNTEGQVAAAVSAVTADHKAPTLDAVEAADPADMTKETQ